MAILTGNVVVLVDGRIITHRMGAVYRAVADGAATRSEIMERTGVSYIEVSNHTNSLVVTGILKPTQGMRTRDRGPIPLRYAVAVPELKFSRNSDLTTASDTVSTDEGAGSGDGETTIEA